MDKSKLHMIQYLVAQVEEQLGWGSGTNWSNKDFEELSDRIFESTKKRLSVTTLKRIWGRAELIANPSSATLDILSEFIGHRNWREFKGSYRSQPLKNAIQKRLKVPHLTVFLLLVLVSVALFTIFRDKDSVITKTTAIISETDFKFRSRTVSNEIPNSVVFEYDASTASDSAVIEIQQDWDKRKRIAIERTDSIATCIYYLPGFFKSKLVVDGVIVKEEDVFIKTQDWLGVIHRDTSPIYLKNDEIRKNGQLSIAPEVLSTYKIDPRTSNVKVGLYQVRDFGGISTNDFELSVQLKNTLQDGLSGCKEAKVFILYDGGAFGIPLSKKGCVSNLNLLVFDQYIDGKKNDLSGFGVDFEDFAELQCISRDNKFEILVNEVQVYEGEAPETPLKIKGVSIQFEGSGTIGNMELKNSSGSFYLNHKGER